MRRNFRNKCAAFMACASVLGSKTSAMNANKNQVKSSQTLGAVKWGAKTQTKKTNCPKILKIGGFFTLGALALEIVHSLIGGLTDSKAGSYSIGRLIRNRVKKDDTEHNPGTDKKWAQHNQTLIQNAFDNITDSDQKTEEYSKQYKPFDKNTESEVVKKLLEEAERYFFNPVGEGFSEYLHVFKSSGVRYATLKSELPDPSAPGYEASKKRLEEKIAAKEFVVLNEQVKQEKQLDDNQNSYVNFIAGCLSGQNKLDSFEIKREILKSGKIYHKFEFKSEDNKIVFYWIFGSSMDIKFNDLSFRYQGMPSKQKLTMEMFTLAKTQ